MKTEIKGILVMVMVGTVTNSTIKADMRYNTSISACCARCLDYLHIQFDIHLFSFCELLSTHQSFSKHEYAISASI